ncbi:MAG: tRNA uridine-5-carboxymethylaminomethyl(34) synthesis enzyme MnmG [Lentisphaerae bacterium]|nr:tRNA uridine-5-carboxymethylaminomethyl(34) synthesis enzyme MnmG [Lentisphaerota bacterium]
MDSALTHYDIVVIGGGHAGCEAALAAARLGARVLLLTINNDHIAQMSCNPAVGGIAKGHVVREIDALGGEMALNTDAACIQFRMLNRSKGAAVQSPRAQCDKVVYQRRMKHVIERCPGLFVHQAQAVRLRVDGERVNGVETEFGDVFTAGAVVVATGTFLAATLHYGLSAFPGGRAGDPAAGALSESLRRDLGLEMARLKTGTPVRVLGRTLDLASLERQDPDPSPGRFAFREDRSDLPRLGGPELPQHPCYLTWSTAETARVVRENLDRSPLYSGRIHGTGARYCPSFEDKVVRFAERERHQVYLEPEGHFTDEYYLNGISTSLPVDVQWLMVRTLPGLERAHISRYAYAIEYDVVLPHQLDRTLAVRRWPNLFLAGQINGTSGYEEAAGQGLVAGVNAAVLAAGRGEALVLGRDEAYIGVMIDDLVTKDIVEPYRLFTSRAEYRLLLRQDNADLRLMRRGHRLGLVSAPDLARLEALEAAIDHGRAFLQQHRHHGRSLWELLRAPGGRYADLPGVPDLPARAIAHLEIESQYEGYTERQVAQAASLRRLEDWAIPPDFDFAQRGISTEARLKLERRRPLTLGQAARIDGVTPAEISLLQVHLHRPRRKSSDSAPADNSAGEAPPGGPGQSRDNQ